MPQIANYEDWIKRSNYDWRHPRSAELKKLDEQVKYYFVNWKGANHENAKALLLREFETYVRKKWSENPKFKPSNVMGITLSLAYPRNKDGAFEDLRSTVHSNTFWIDRRLKAAQDALMEGQQGLLDRLLYTQAGVPLQFTLKEKISIKDKFKAGVRAAAISAKGQFNGGKTFNPNHTPGKVGGEAGSTLSATDKAQFGYQGARLGYKTYEAVEHIEHFAASNPSTIGSQCTRELTPILGNEIAGHVGTAIGEAVPIIGHVISGIVLVKAVVEVAMVHMLKEDLSQISNMGYPAPGTPQAAVDAVIGLYKRIATQKDIDLGMAVVKFGAQFDPTRAVSSTVGATDAARKIITLIATMIMEYKEIKAANDIISRKLYKSNFEQMFVSCPLLGAYVIVGSETSSIINAAVKFYGTNGWNVQVESMRKSIQKLYDASTNLIDESKYEIVGFPKRAMKQKDIPATCVSQSLRAAMVKDRIVGISGPAAV